MTEHSATKPDTEAFFDPGGGAVSRGLERLQLVPGARLRIGWLAVLLAAVTWLPLLVLTVVDGVAWGDAVQVPFREQTLGEDAAADTIEQAVMHVTGDKLKSLAAGRMGYTTSQVGDLVAHRAVNGS